MTEVDCKRKTYAENLQTFFFFVQTNLFYIYICLKIHFDIWAKFLYEFLKHSCPHSGSNTHSLNMKFRTHEQTISPVLSNTQVLFFYKHTVYQIKQPQHFPIARCLVGPSSTLSRVLSVWRMVLKILYASPFQYNNVSIESFLQ